MRIDSIRNCGDVRALPGVAEALRQRGHRVTVVLDNGFANVILRSDLEFDLSTPEESAELLQPSRFLASDALLSLH